MKRFIKVSDGERKRAYLIVLLWPFAGLIYSIRNFRLPYAKNIFFFFCIFFGLAFIYNQTGSSGADSGRYADLLKELHASTQSLTEIWTDIYSSESNSVDIYQPLLTFFISRFTGNPRILFLAFAIVFGYFYSRNLWFIFEKINHRVTFPIFLYMLGFGLICPIWFINGVRMWTALHVFVFGALPYLFNGNKKSLIWCGLSVFIHFSFIIPVVLTIIYLFLPKNILIVYFSLFIVTSFVTELNIPAIHNTISAYSPKFIEKKINSYVKEGEVEEEIEVQPEPSLKIVLYKKAYSSLFYVIVLFMFIGGRKQIQNNPALLKLFSYGLFLYSFSQLLSNLPSMGRFITVSQMFILPSFIFFLNELPRRKQTLYPGIFSIRYKRRIIVPSEIKFKDFRRLSITTYFLNPIMCYIIFMNIPLNEFSIFTLYGNPVLAFFIDHNISIMDHIKHFLR